MKWNDLSFTDRKKFYDTIRKDNPRASYFQIKDYFNSIPSYENGEEGEQSPISFISKQLNKPIVGGITGGDIGKFLFELTPAGYLINGYDAYNQVKQGDYKGAATNLALNVLPFGAGKIAKNIRKIGSISDIVEAYSRPASVAKEAAKEARYNSEFNEFIVRNRRANQYNDEANRTINTALNSNTTKNIDSKFGTNYSEVYSKIQSLNDNHRLIQYKPLESGYGKAVRNGDNYNVVFDLDEYMPGTANHELGHIADMMTNSVVVERNGKKYLTNPYLEYLVDESNALTKDELIQLGNAGVSATREYLLNPTEAKSHMLGLKRTLLDSGVIKSWDEPITEQMIKDYMNTPIHNRMLDRQYQLYRDKDRYIKRINSLPPMIYTSPIIPTGLFINEEIMEGVYPEYPTYKNGGIHIKKKNRGKFTETMKRTGKSAEELKHSKNPLTRKRATFALNARRWARNRKKK